jgi:hypothetical protein
MKIVHSLSILLWWLPGLTTAFAPTTTTNGGNNRRLLTVPPRVNDYVKFGSSGRSSIVRFATKPEKKDRIIEQRNIDKKDAEAHFLDKISAKNLFEGVPYTWLTIGVLKEDLPGENRVSQTPDTVRSLVKEGFNVIVEEGGRLLIYSIYLACFSF